uniref:Gamma-glutamyltransferase n=1 Tax=Dendroctonus ponderosae TaxID=77166 RepID=A0AAR5Q836_DENPD
MTNSENRTVEETTREDIPLKTGTKQSKWYNCNEDCMGGSKFINVAFGVLTIIVTIALIVQIYYGDYQVVPHGSVATDSLECSRVGTQILKQGGKAVDAAIASAFCMAVVAPHLTGLDAEGQVLIYSHRTRISPDLVDFSGSNVISDRMPRLVLGLAYIHQQYATMPWKSLVEPSIGIARLGNLNLIAGKRLVFGANGVAQASQLVVNLIIGAKNATDGVEFPRFYLLDNATIAVEAAHSPKFQLELLEYLKAAHREPVLMPEPYYSSNAVEKLKDELSSHSDSRGGGIASRF